MLRSFIICEAKTEKSNSRVLLEFPMFFWSPQSVCIILLAKCHLHLQKEEGRSNEKEKGKHEQ
jgi:hypothetical protein